MPISGSFPNLTVTNFGPLKNAEIELRPLTVFVGPSNTGKSYLSILIYALHSYFSSYKSDTYLNHDEEINSLINSLTSNDSSPFSNPFWKINYFFNALRSNPLNAPSDVVIPDPVTDIVKEMYHKYLGLDLHDEISRCFGVEIKDLIRKNTQSNSTIEFQTAPKNHDGFINYKLTIESEKTYFETTVSEHMPLKLLSQSADLTLDRSGLLTRLVLEDIFAPKNSTLNKDHITFLLQNIARYLAVDLCEPFSQSAHYLPSARTGIMHAHTSIVSSIVSNSAKTGIRQRKEMTPLSGILVDFLEKLVYFGSTIPSNNGDLSHQDEIANIIEEIEGAILSGTILTESSDIVNYPQFRYRPSGWDSSIALANASSMISELAPILLYLRHQVNPGNILIIEEPESGMHPSMQVRFTRQLVAMVNAGIRIIITTHSEWIMEELANLVKLSSLSESDRMTIDAGDAAINSELVGAWLFHNETESNIPTVSRIDLDESGLYPTGFDDVARVLYSNWSLISRLQN